ncbi:MAG: hypothetical protein ACK4TA_19875 [Saprospiraceae bacterium]
MEELQIPLHEKFEDDGEVYVQNNKVHSSLIWHEAGHLIGFKIAQELGCNFDGTFTELKFHDAFGISPKVSYNFTSYLPKNKFFTYEDENRELYNYYNSKEDRKKINDELENLGKFAKYLIYLLSGGLFNIYYFQKNPTYEDFEKCFYTNTNNNIYEDNFYGQAGADWTRLNSLSKLKNWDLAIFKDYRKELFDVMKSHQLFEKFRDLIEELDNHYNGLSVTEASEIQEILNKIELRLSPFDELKSDLQNLTEKFQIKLEKQK